MVRSFEGMGPHDAGSDSHPDALGPIDTTDHGMTHWEKHANALRMVVTGKDFGTLDEMRRACEDLGERYYQISYFERQTEALAKVMCERGKMSPALLEKRMAEITQRFAATPIVPLPPLPEDHDHTADHFKEDEKGEGPNHHHLMNLAIQELLQEQELIKPEEVTCMIVNFDAEYPNRGPKVVACAWLDSAYRVRLLKDARLAIEEVGIDLEYQARIIALENTPKIHNVIVCTLCSCYPRFLLGQPPTWYKSRSYRSRVVHEPRAVLKEFGTVLPKNVSIRVHDSNADMRYLVVPMRPEGTEGWGAQELEKIVTRDCLIGVALPDATI